MNGSEKNWVLLKFLVIWLSVSVVGGCTHFSNGAAQPALNISVSEPDRIRFSGKGAGAGMMMAGAMGPMGIAIGVAIDEGIGKDIDSTARQGSVDIVNIIRDVVESAFEGKATGVGKYRGKGAINIEVKRYGFITAPGEGDRVQAQLHLSFQLDENGSDKKSVRIPEDLTGDAKAVLATYPLDEIKTNAETIRKAFTQAAQIAVAKGLGESW